MITRRQAVGLCAGGAATIAAAQKKSSAAENIRVSRVPDAGLQPQLAIDSLGSLHVVYYKGDPRQGDVFYVSSHDGGRSFSAPLQVNSHAGSAIAAGTIRGAQLALGRDGWVHVAWNGSMSAQPKGPLNPDSGKPGMPMLYSRLRPKAKAFEPQRNLMNRSFGLDGGGSVASDNKGNVYVSWHGISQTEASGSGKEGEARRRVWIGRSTNDGETFSPEERAWDQSTGACGCCGMKIFSTRQGAVFALYRSATESIHRDIYLLKSKDHGQSFTGNLLHKWEINACPMSSMDFAENGRDVIGAWETGGQVYWARLSSKEVSPPVPAAGDGKGRKHPRVALNRHGQVLLVWTEGTGWQKGGSLAYQLFDLSGHEISAPKIAPGVPVWSFGAAGTVSDGSFVVLY